MTTLIRKIANNLTSSLNLFFLSTLNNHKKVTNKVTQVTKMLRNLEPTGFVVDFKNLRKNSGEPGNRETTGLSLSPIHYHGCNILKFVKLYGNPITIGDVKNDKN